MNAISCLVLIGPVGRSAAEKWVFEGQLAASLDLIERLLATPAIGNITVMTPEPDTIPLKAPERLSIRKSDHNDFVFGSTLLTWAQERAEGPLAYFGGSSAPLLTGQHLDRLTDGLAEEQGPEVITNNRFSSDWVLMKHIQGAEEFLASLESDNPLGWGLENQVGFRVRDMPASSISRTDIDTPMDLLMLLDHPSVGPNLRLWLDQVDANALSSVQSIRELLATAASTLMVIGRSSAAAWAQLEKQTQVWTRLLVEERGMLASGRFRRDEVKSIVASYIENVGIDDFVSEISLMSDGVVWDNRVWLAASGGWPSKNERFAADLGWGDELSDARLCKLVEAIEHTNIPILCGGHSVVSGGLMALLEGIA